MISLTSCRSFKMDNLPVDVLERKHRYKVYLSGRPRQLLQKFYNYSLLSKFLQSHDFRKDVYVELQYLGHDNFYYTFEKRYYSFISNQLNLL